MRLRNKKTAEALHYLLANSKERKLSILLLLKLLFFADRHLLLHEGKTISNSKYVAMKLGPVSSRANNILYKKISYLNEDSDDDINNYFSFNYVAPKYNSLVSIKNISQYTSLSSFDKEALNIALKIFKIEPNLCELSHKFYEWKKHESWVQEKINRSAKMDLLDCFDSSQFPHFNNELDDIFVIDEKDLLLSKECYLGN